MSERPKNSSLDAQVSPGSWSSASQHMSSAQESGELGGASLPMVCGRPAREGDKPQAVGARKAPQPHAAEQSGAPIVPGKPVNSWVTPEESVEGRRAADGKPAQRNAPRMQGREGALTALERVGQRARERKGERFVNLLSHIKAPLLKEAYLCLKKNAAAGVDGETWKSYGEDLDVRLLDLQDRVQRGSYHPQPVRRVYIAKPDGRKRPLGIPALEDKIVQQAARMLLEPIYESEFLGFSYGCRPGRSQHKALGALFEALSGKTNWVLDADIRSFYDTIDFGWMQKFLEHRIGDRRMVRLLMKWLKAGVVEEGKLLEVEAGTPQGGVISPLLANIYLHYALDLWVQQWRKRPACGQVYIVRYVDDVVMGFQYEGDARAMRAAVAERLVTFKLELHPEKTRVLRFGRFARKNCTRDGRQRPETFDFLGFTHICGVDPRRKTTFRLLRRTSRKKRVMKLAALEQEIRRRRHAPVVDQYRWLCSVLRGHYAYYGVSGNFRALASVRNRLRRAWHRALQRRSQRARWNQQKHDAFDARFPLPKARITHPSPLKRFSCP